jgi:hypothetical protein
MNLDSEIPTKRTTLAKTIASTNKYLKSLAESLKKKEKSNAGEQCWRAMLASNAGEELGWIATLLTDPD